MGVEISAVNSWGKSEKEITKQIGQYVTDFLDPVFRYGGIAKYRSNTMFFGRSGSELAIHMGLPRRSVCGLPVIEHADFEESCNLRTSFKRRQHKSGVKSLIWERQVRMR